MTGILLCVGSTSTAYAAKVPETVMETEQSEEIYRAAEAIESEFETSGTDDALTIVKYKGTASVVDLAVVFQGKTIVAIGQDAFRDNNKLTEVILPDTVKTIGTCAFQGCTLLKTVRGAENVTQIGENAFRRCILLFNIDTSSAISIGKEAFRECKSLKSLTIPEGTTQLADSVFYASGLTEINLPSTCGVIGNSALRETKLTEIAIPDQCTEIKDSAFMHCESLQKVTFGEDSKLQSIGASFNYCTVLKSIAIPAGCTSIGSSCFSNAYALEMIKFYNKDTVIADGAFYGQNDLTVCAEPEGAVENYMKVHYPDSSRYRFNRFTDKLTIQKLPKTDYFYGDNFSTEGLEVLADFTSDTDPAQALVAVSDCKISGYSPIKSGSQTITVAYGGAETSYTVENYYNMDKVTVQTDGNLTYTGSPVEPDFKITGKETGKTLVKGTDYTVSYEGNHTDAGEVKVSFTGIGTYRGTKAFTYRIQAKNLSDADVTAESVQLGYTGAELKPEPKISYGNKILGTADFSNIVYNNNVNCGTASYTVTGTGNYTGSKTVEFKIVYNMENTVVDPVADQTYTGAAVEPVFTVRTGEDGNVLTAGTDYIVKIDGDHTNVGTVTATISGIGTCYGTKEITYRIVPKNLGDADITAETSVLKYTGKELTPEPVLYYGNVKIGMSDFSAVNYQNNINCGVADYTVQGTGNYTGTKTVFFQINLANGTKASAGNYRYKVTSAKEAALIGFAGKNVTKVTVPKEVTIGGVKLKVTSISSKAFYKNTKITAVTIGKNVRTIDKSAFEGCKKLKNVTIGADITKISDKAFKNCSRLQTVKIDSKKLKSMGKESFKGVKSNVTVKVPAKKLDAYQKLLKKSGLSSKAKIKKA